MLTTVLRHLGGILLFLWLSTSLSAQAQAPIGLWSVTEVKVGEEVMTPTAKWFFIHGDHGLTAGNGYLTNQTGSWAWQADTQTLLFANEQGEQDPAGPFQVSVSDDHMTWQREEEGLAVTVQLQHVAEKPLAPWDRLVGLWQVVQPEDEDGADRIFLRWDRRYINRGFANGGNAGVWHFHAHRPELRLLSDQGDEHDSRWQVTFPEPDLMTWTRLDAADAAQLIEFTRQPL